MHTPAMENIALKKKLTDVHRYYANIKVTEKVEEE